MIDVKRIRHLRAVASHPTVQAAADALNITQSALTKSIARFEDDLEAPLFDRQGHRLALTELGQHLVNRGEAFLRQVRTLEEEVSLWKGMGTGEVSVGVDPEAEFGLLPEVLAEFVPAHPGVMVSLRSAHTEVLLPALLEGEIHFVVADAEVALGHDSLEIRELTSSPIAVALRPGHPLIDEHRPKPADVARYPRVGASTAPRFERWRKERVRREGAEPHAPSLVSDNYELLVQLAERSDAIVFGPLDLLTIYEAQGRLKVVPWPLDGPDTQSSLIRLKERLLSPSAERLISLILDSPVK